MSLKVGFGSRLSLTESNSFLELVKEASYLSGDKQNKVKSTIIYLLDASVIFILLIQLLKPP